MKQLEDKLQEAAVTWFRLQYPNTVIFSIPNGGSRNPIEAAKLKRTGTLAGVADLFIMKAAWVDMAENFDVRIYHGFFIELKAGKNQKTEAQKLFQEKAIEAGYKYAVIRSIDEFMNVVKNYML